MSFNISGMICFASTKLVGLMSHGWVWRLKLLALPNSVQIRCGDFSSCDQMDCESIYQLATKQLQHENQSTIEAKLLLKAQYFDNGHTETFLFRQF